MTSNLRARTCAPGSQTLEAAGELIRIDKPVDPLTQMGSLLYQSREKALLFENLPHGWRSLGQAPANVRHAALAFGTTPGKGGAAGRRAHGQAHRARDGRRMRRSRRSSSASGEFDLTKLPVHIAGQRDGGPVIGSGPGGDQGSRHRPAQRQLPSAADQGAEQVRHPALSAPYLEELPEIPGAQRADAGRDLHRPPSALLRGGGDHGGLRARRIRDRRRLPGGAGARW